MPETRRKFDPEFREGAVRIVRETGKPIAQIARDLGIQRGHAGQLGCQDRAERDGTEGLSPGCGRVEAAAGGERASCGWSAMSSSAPWSCG